MRRIARDVSVQLFRPVPGGTRFLMLHRIPVRGGFWQGVTGAPLPGESDIDAAVREVCEETGYDVRDRLIPLETTYSHSLRPVADEQWDARYGPGVTSIPVVSFGAEVPGAHEPVLDPGEHDAFAWCTLEEAEARLDWPIEADAHAGRRRALAELARRIDEEG